jgi:hypothetical protein
LLLLWIGSFDRTLISRFKRTQKYSAEDFDLLVSLLKRIPSIVTTPHVLTEVSNLAGQLPENIAEEFRSELRIVFDRLNEQNFPCRNVAAETGFITLGLTDCSLTLLARQKVLVLTDDFPLYANLDAQSMPVINFTHVRSSAYGWQT